MDKSGAILAAACWNCGDKALSLRPKLELQKLVSMWREEEAAKDDPAFAQEMREALSNTQSMQNNDTRPMDLFAPNGKVSELHAYGIRVIQTYALVTESEYQQLVKYNLLEIKQKKSFTLPFRGPLQNLQFWLLDLKDLDPATAQSVRKVEITCSTQAELEQVFLHPEQQIHQKQPWHVFDHRAGKHFDKRPDALRPAARRPDTVEQAMQAHLFKKSKRASQVANAQSAGSGPADAEELELAKAEVPTLKMGVAGDDDDELASKPKRRRAGAAAQGKRGFQAGATTASEPCARRRRALRGKVAPALAPPARRSTARRPIPRNPLN